MRCEHCDSTEPVEDGWVRLIRGIKRGRGERSEYVEFCHTGCLVHWLAGKVPEYFEELEV